jgi:dihydroorotate dehydrogenase
MLPPSLVSVLLPALRVIDAERAHETAIWALRHRLAGAVPAQPDPALAVNAFGLAFPNPLGLAAGFDKNAAALAGLSQLGFGYIEAGTVTLRPQAGNARPRLFRLAEDGAIINRMGFNNDGAEAFRQRLRLHVPHPVPLGVNIGLNKLGGDAEKDYPALATALAPFADYLTINVSSPNTPGLRDLQAPDRLGRIIAGVTTACGGTTPVLVKLAPDLDDESFDAIVETCADAGAAGVIISNTTIGRPAELRGRHASESGGLSGRPLFARSTALLRRAHAIAGGRVVLVGCGGIFSGEDAWAKIRAGATLLQLYTAFIYGGPAAVARINRELLACMRRDGFTRLADAVAA